MHAPVSETTDNAECRCAEGGAVGRDKQGKVPRDVDVNERGRLERWWKAGLLARESLASAWVQSQARNRCSLLLVAGAAQTQQARDQSGRRDAPSPAVAAAGRGQKQARVRARVWLARRSRASSRARREACRRRCRRRRGGGGGGGGDWAAGGAKGALDSRERWCTVETVVADGRRQAGRAGPGVVSADRLEQSAWESGWAG